MSGIVININPVALEIGGFELRWYSIAIVLAITIGVAIVTRKVKSSGINATSMYGLIPWLLIGGLLGARLFHVVDRWDYYSDNLSLILQLQHGGLAIWGGLITGLVIAVVYTRVKRISLPRLLDVLVPALLVAQIIGRFGCIINGDAYGGITSLPWGFIYTHPDASIPSHLLGVPTHPYPVYEILWNLSALALFYCFRKYFRHEGILFLAYLAHYSVVRFVLTFVRQENVFLGGLQQAQIVAILGFAASAVLFIYVMIKARHFKYANSGASA